MKIKRIAVDIDGTLCEEVSGFDKPLAPPIKEGVDVVNELFYKGHLIFLFTGRSWNEYRTTKEWLKRNNVAHHELIMGKVGYDLIIDDRSRQPDWSALREELLS